MLISPPQQIHKQTLAVRLGITLLFLLVIVPLVIGAVNARPDKPEPVLLWIAAVRETRFQAMPIQAGGGLLGYAAVAAARRVGGKAATTKVRLDVIGRDGRRIQITKAAIFGQFLRLKRKGKMLDICRVRTDKVPNVLVSLDLIESLGAGAGESHVIDPLARVQ